MSILLFIILLRPCIICVAIKTFYIKTNNIAIIIYEQHTVHNITIRKQSRNANDKKT